MTFEEKVNYSSQTPPLTINYQPLVLFLYRFASPTASPYQIARAFLVVRYQCDFTIFCFSITHFIHFFNQNLLKLLLKNFVKQPPSILYVLGHSIKIYKTCFNKIKNFLSEESTKLLVIGCFFCDWIVLLSYGWDIFWP